jgi:hypothetical protein
VRSFSASYRLQSALQLALRDAAHRRVVCATLRFRTRLPPSGLLPRGLRFRRLLPQSLHLTHTIHVRGPCGCAAVALSNCGVDAGRMCWESHGRVCGSWTIRTGLSVVYLRHPAFALLAPAISSPSAMPANTLWRAQQGSPVFLHTLLAHCPSSYCVALRTYSTRASYR